MGADLEFDVATVVDGIAWRDGVRDARTALAHQLIGASRRMLGLAQAHAMDRIQFGRSIASFQAVRHKLAESLVAIEAAAAAADAAVGVPDDLMAALAKSLAGKAARVTATQAQQVLAGIGFTTEHPFHRFLKRTMVIDTLFGSARTLPAEIGRALLAQRNAPRLIEL
jgi:alkylation response protein AidB-like acyl-CoA dehydrogenase